MLAWLIRLTDENIRSLCMSLTRVFLVLGVFYHWLYWDQSSTRKRSEPTEKCTSRAGSKFEFNSHEYAWVINYKLALHDFLDWDLN